MAKQNWAPVLAQVRNPLVFFALGLLVIESGIGVVAAFRLEDEHLLYAFGLMAALFVVVVALVAAITFWRPGHLFEQVAELKKTINSEGFQDIIEDAIIELVKEECLQPLQRASSDGKQSV